MTQKSEQQFRNRIRKVIFEMHIDAQGNLQDDMGHEEILYNYDQGRRFAKNILQKYIPNLREYELADYFPASGEKESYMFEQYLMRGDVYNVFVEHEIIHHTPHWKLVYGKPQPGGEPGDPKALEVLWETPMIPTLEQFVQYVNKESRAWDFDVW